MKTVYIAYYLSFNKVKYLSSNKEFSSNINNAMLFNSHEQFINHINVNGINTPLQLSRHYIGIEQPKRETLTSNIELSDIKRLYVNFDVKCLCPKCNSLLKDNNEYFSYAQENENIDFYLRCNNCKSRYVSTATIKSSQISIEIDYTKLNEQQ